jgi:hypothetical protein
LRVISTAAQQRADHVAERLAHLAAVRIADHRVEVDLLEGHLQAHCASSARRRNSGLITLPSVLLVLRPCTSRTIARRYTCLMGTCSHEK